MKTTRALPHLLLVLVAAGFVSADLSSAPPPVLAKNPEKKFVPYRITRGDRLSVSVVGEPDLMLGGRRVESTGTINMLLINNVRVVGLTISEAQETIANAYRDGRFLRNPQVAITVEEYAPRIVKISGKVNSPGQINIPPDSEMTILDVIFKANGLSETAKASAIRVTRTMPDGTEKLFTLDVEAAIKARGKSTGDGGFVVQPDDVVYVQEKII